MAVRIPCGSPRWRRGHPHKALPTAISTLAAGYTLYCSAEGSGREAGRGQRTQALTAIPSFPAYSKKRGPPFLSFLFRFVSFLSLPLSLLHSHRCRVPPVPLQKKIPKSHPFLFISIFSLLEPSFNPPPTDFGSLLCLSLRLVSSSSRRRLSFSIKSRSLFARRSAFPASRSECFGFYMIIKAIIYRLCYDGRWWEGGRPEGGEGKVPGGRGGIRWGHRPHETPPLSPLPRKKTEKEAFPNHSTFL